MEIKAKDKIRGIVYAYTREKRYDMVRDLGIEYIRLGVAFPWTDRMHGTISPGWIATKKEYREAVDAGLKVMASTPGMGGWNYDSEKGITCWHDSWPEFVGKPGTPEFYANVAETTKFMCEDLGDLASDIWQCMNEIDIDTFRGDYPIEVAVDTCRASAEGIVAANPNAVCGTNFAGWYDFAKEVGDLLFRPGHHFGYVGDDQYYGSWQPYTVEKWNETLDEMWERWNIPILINEWGYSSAGVTLTEHPKETVPGLSDVCIAKAWFNEVEGGHNEETQAEYFRRGLEIFAKNPHVLGNFVFCFSDAEHCWHCGQSECPAECFWGITDIHCRPKKAYYAVQKAIREYYIDAE